MNVDVSCLQRAARRAALSALACLLGGHVAASAAELPPLQSVEELPVDRFDEYPAGALPPFPWELVGTLTPGVGLALEREAESPFVGNKGTGKALVLRDASRTAGDGVGIACAFVAPPAGDLYLGFDFRVEPAEGDAGIGLRVELGDGGDGAAASTSVGLAFTILPTSLSVAGADGVATHLADLKAGEWYHLGAVLSPDGRLTATLNRGGNVKAAETLPACQLAVSETPPTRLSFTGTGDAERQGAWSLDNICMAGRVEADRRAWLPFDQLPLAELSQSKKKVFAYYFIYGSGVSSKDPGLTWYTRTVLNPTANTKGDRKEAGTELLYRPFPRPPLPADLSSDDEMLEARKEEVRLARNAGFDGFLVDFWAEPNGSNGQSYFSKNSFALLDAALAISPDFKIVPAVYSASTKGGANGEADEGCDPIAYANSPVITRILAHPAVQRMPDGRPTLSMWLTERHSVGWWEQVLAELARKGTPVALISQFNTKTHMKEFSPISAGMAHWGPRQPSVFNWVELTRDLTPTVIFPICEQDVRTRGCTLWESGGSETLTGLWQQAIDDGADWTFLISWSDYSEQAMQPSTYIGFAPHDLNAYYSQWFKTGKQPAIVRDTLYYFYRRNHTEVDPGQGTKWKFRSYNEVRNEIELLAFLEKPGTLRIEVQGKVYERYALAGITRFAVPLPPDATFVPSFSLVRDDQVVVERRGHYTVQDEVEYPHMLYSSGVIAPPRAVVEPPKRSLLWRLFH